MTTKAIIEKVGRPSEPLISRGQIPTHVASLRIDRTPNLEHDVTGQRYGEFGTNLRRCKLEQQPYTSFDSMRRKEQPQSWTPLMAPPEANARRPSFHSCSSCYEIGWNSLPNGMPLTCGTRESRYHRARGDRASGPRCRQVQRLVSQPNYFVLVRAPRPHGRFRQLAFERQVVALRDQTARRGARGALHAKPRPGGRRTRQPRGSRDRGARR
jgi:hypothetical protein